MADQRGYTIGIPTGGGYSTGGGTHPSYSTGSTSHGYTIGIPLGGYTVHGGQHITGADLQHIASSGSGGGGFFSGIESVLGNAGGQAADIIHGIPNAVTHTAQAIQYDFGKGGTESLSQAWNDPRGLIGGVVKPQVVVAHKDAQALRRGDWNYFEKNPLNPVLDVLTVASLGGKGVLGAARTGVLGERAAALAKGERALTVGDHAEIITQSKTLQGRLRQHIFDQFSQQHPDMPIIGVNARMNKILTKRAATMTLRAGLPVRDFQRVTSGLQPAEVFAFHVAAEGVPLGDRIAYYHAQLRELGGGGKGSRPITQYLANLESPAVRDVLENPRPEFIQALHSGAALEAKAGARLVSTGALTAETRAERAALPQREMAPPPTLGAAPASIAGEPLSVPLPEPAVPHAAGATFIVKLPRLFYEDVKNRADLGGMRFEERTKNSETVRVRVDQQAFQRLEHLAKTLPQHSHIRAGVRALAEQRNALQDTIIKAGQRLHWATSRQTGEWRVADYHVTPKGGGYEVSKSGEVIGQYREVGEAKRAVERDVAHRRAEALQVERIAQAGEDPFMAAIDNPTGALPEPARAAGPVDSILGLTRREPSMTTNLVNPDFPAPFRFPHVGKQGGAGLFTAPKTPSMLGKATPLRQLRHNAAIRLQNALLLTDPERVLSTDFLQTMRHETIIQMQKQALDPISQALSRGHAETGFKAPGEWYYRPSYDRKTTAPVPRHVREMEALHQDQSLVNGDLARTGSEKAGQGVVSKDLRGLGIDARDVHNLDKLNALGIRRVPAAFGKEFSKEFGGTHWAIRYFYDRPLDVWRAITLNFRPAWAVNNFVGNGVMGLARYGPQGAVTYLHMLLATEKGDQKVRTLFNFTMKHPTLRRKYAGVFQEVAPELHSAGLYGTQTRVTNPGIYEGKLAGFTANPAVRAAGLVPKAVGRGVMKVGRGVTKVEILFAEDTGREAAFIREAGGDLAKIQKTARNMGEGNLSLAESLKRLDQHSVEKAVRGVNDALGDFNDLSPFERSVLRRLIPFYSWFKVITKISAKYAARYPARLLLLKNITAAQKTAGEPALPGWLRGSVLVGGPHNGVQTLFSTQGVNPYETLNQVATGGAGSVISPFATAGIVGLTGRDPSFGTTQDYYGWGATTKTGWRGQAERAAGSFFSGLAPARVYSQTTGPYQGKLYTPRTYGHVGPVSINDFLLQYLGIPIRHVNVQEARHQSGLQ